MELLGIAEGKQDEESKDKPRKRRRQDPSTRQLLNLFVESLRDALLQQMIENNKGQSERDNIKKLVAPRGIHFELPSSIATIAHKCNRSQNRLFRNQTGTMEEFAIVEGDDIGLKQNDPVWESVSSDDWENQVEITLKRICHVEMSSKDDDDEMHVYLPGRGYRAHHQVGSVLLYSLLQEVIIPLFGDQLQSVRVSGWPLCQRSLSLLFCARYFPRLQCLSFVNCNFLQLFPSLFTVHPLIKDLQLISCSIDDADFHSHRALHYCNHMALIQACPSLISLKALECDTAPAAGIMHALAAYCPNLATLHLGAHCEAFFRGVEQFRDADIAVLAAHCQQLRSLVLPLSEERNLSTRSLAALMRDCRMLEELLIQSDVLRWQPTGDESMETSDDEVSPFITGMVDGGIVLVTIAGMYMYLSA